MVTLIVGVGMFFLLLKPRMEELSQVRAKLAERQAVANQLESARLDLAQARQENLEARLDYRRYEESKMPVLSFQDRTAGMIALWREHAEVLGPLIEKWPRKFGVDLQTQISVPAAVADPNALPSGLIQIPIGEITVRGDYQSILNHMRGWNRFNRLVRVGPPNLSGISPNLTATYDLTVMFYPRTEPGDQVAMAAPAAQAGQGGAAGPMGAPPPMPAPPGTPQGAPPMPPPAPGGAAEAPPPPTGGP